MIYCDKWGFPVELFENRPVTNLIRIVIHTSIYQTWKYNFKREIVDLTCCRYDPNNRIKTHVTELPKGNGKP